MSGAIAGRDSELAFLRVFVESVPDGAAALVLEGEAGMGKTTLWRAGVAEANGRGLRVLHALPAESETELSFAGLGDLLEPVLAEALEPLPSGQRAALSRALVLEDVEGPAPDAHAVGVALLGAVRALTTSAPVLVAVDDVQWLDAASAAALAYACRRLRGEPVGVLLARREGLASALAEELDRSFGERAARFEVGPLDASALHRVVSDRLGTTLPRPLLAEVSQASGGNPFYAIEIVRTLQRRGIEVEAGRPLPVPDSLQDLVEERLTALPEQSRVFLLAAAAHAHPTVVITEAASGVTADAGLAPAVGAGIVELDGSKIRFTHPLLAAGVLEAADARRRAEVHARLAELLDDPEARAWQLAASVDEADEDVAQALEDAARHARARGAPRPAALLLERARQVTPTTNVEGAARRAIDAATLQFESGDVPRAEAQFLDVLQTAHGAGRARALCGLGRLRLYDRWSEATELFRRALEEDQADARTQAMSYEGLAECLVRQHQDLAAAVAYARRAGRLAVEIHDEPLAASALGSQLLAETFLGRKSARVTARKALALQERARRLRVLSQPLFSVAVSWCLGEELEKAHGAFTELLGQAAERGDESAVPYVLYLLGWVECALGNLEAAFARALDGARNAVETGQDAVLAYHLGLQAFVGAQLGDQAAAREAARAATERAAADDFWEARLNARWAIGHLELSLGHPDVVVEQLGSHVDFVRRGAIAEPNEQRFVTDFAEGLIELGRRDEALELLGWYEGQARRLRRASALANCARCRGLVAAQEGDLVAALAAFDEALAWHVKVELPLDRGRTLLALGATQRRMKRRREARATLEEALAVFEGIGAALWAERARRELRRISGRAATPGALTPAEERVAALVAVGKTNREVAAALFLSERTVEGHLSRVFGKLGIRHRTELSRALDARQTQVVAASNTGDTPVSAAPPAP